MIDFRDITIQEERLKNRLEKWNFQDRSRILTALELARRAHERQKRDEGDPYIIHPMRVTNTLIGDLNVTDSDMIIAGLLHDVVEDTDISLAEIRRKFGERVVKLVSALTRDKEKETKKDKFEKTVNGPEDVRLIKACDWLDNLRSFIYRTDRGERWQRHLKEAKEMYIPLAEATRDDRLVMEMKNAYEAVLRLR